MTVCTLLYKNNRREFVTDHMVFNLIFCYNDCVPGASATGFFGEKMMPIVQTVDFYDFRRAFADADRDNQFSYSGMEMLFNYLENLSEDIGEPINLDVVGLCCEYAEEHYKDIANNYGIDLSEAEGDESEEIEIVVEYLENNTTVCGYDEDTGMIVYALF